MKYLSKAIVFCLVFTANSILAGEIANKVTITAPSNNSANIPMTISSDSKMVKEFLGKYNAAQAKARSKNILPGALPRTDMPKRKINNTVIKAKNIKPVVIHLDVPDVQPPVVNTTEHFVFRDITSRGTNIADLSNDIAKRTRKIELLRQAAAKR